MQQLKHDDMSSALLILIVFVKIYGLIRLGVLLFGDLILDVTSLNVTDLVEHSHKLVALTRLDVLVLEAEVKESGNFSGQLLDQVADSKGGGADQDAEAVLLLGQARGTREDSAELNHNVLESND